MDRTECTHSEPTRFLGRSRSHFEILLVSLLLGVLKHIFFLLYTHIPIIWELKELKVLLNVEVTIAEVQG